MHIPHGQSVAYESGQRHEIELVLTALHDADIPATDVCYSDTGEAPMPGQTPFTLWLVLVPTGVLSAARAVIAPLPVSRADPAVPLVASAPADHTLVVLTCVVALALLLIIIFARG
jgi:hypothetical protein